MLQTGTVSLLLLWGVWLLIPAVVDLLEAMRIVAYTLSHPLPATLGVEGMTRWPTVSVLVPCHQGAACLPACVRSLAAQTYPMAALEVVVIDNASTDTTVDVVHVLQTHHPELTLSLVHLHEAGKAGALNAGIHATRGHYVCNVDADVQMDPDAIATMVAAFEADPAMGAATGAVLVARPEPPPVSWFLRQVQAAERMEYLTSFRAGRYYQDATDSLFTLAGAFSFFRRDLLAKSFLYREDTVAEDTRLTFDLRTRGAAEGLRVGCVPQAVVTTDPIPSLAALYAQRARWQRGELEVAALQAIPRRAGLWWACRHFLGRALLTDHTLAYPRLIWTFLLPWMFWFGYPPGTILLALLLLYGVYLISDGVLLCTVGRSLRPTERRDLTADLRTLWLLPAFRMLVFWFRLGGILNAQLEPARWAEADPVTQLRRRLQANPPASR